MKMSKRMFEIFRDFYNFTVDNASDEEVANILNNIRSTALEKAAESNPNMDEHNKAIIREFFEEFLAKANDDDAIYLIEVIKSACDKINKDPKSVAKFVAEKKKEALENAKKD